MRRRILLSLLLLVFTLIPGGAFAQDADIPINQGQFQDLQPVTPGVVQTTGGGQTVTQSRGGGLNLFPIVPCGTRGTGRCTACGFLDILENLIKFITFGVTGPIAAVIFIYAGFQYMFARGNPERLSNAKRILTNAIYGVAIILLAWVIVVQLIKTIAPGSAADKWYEFNCPEFLQGAGDEPESKLTSDFGQFESNTEEWKQICTNPSVVSARNGNSKGGVNSAELDAMIACLTNDPIIKEIVDTSNQFTYEEINTNHPLEPLCDVRRGNNDAEAKLCGVAPCAHGAGGTYSCHYGGETGTNGAEAVDFNIKKTNPDWVCLEAFKEKDNDGNDTGRCLCPTGNWCGTREDGSTYKIAPNDDRALERELQRVAKKNNCAVKRLAYESPPHVHVSTLACDKD